MTRLFSAWKVGAIHFVPALLLSAACFCLVFRGYKWAWIGAIVFLVYGLFSLFFFRDPWRAITAQPNEVVSPADGTVVAVEDLKETPYYTGPCLRISIFLSIFNVHVNRAPFEGTVQDIRHKDGAFKYAMRDDASDLNESNGIWLETPRGPMTIRQISGAVARRIVCAAKVGDTLAKGEKFGMIKFGSRTELYLPTGTAVCVKKGDTVRAGTTIVARF